MDMLARRLSISAVLAVVLLGNVAPRPAFAATDITGTWQGLLLSPPSVHRILKITRDAGGVFHAIIYSPDETAAPIRPASVKLDGLRLTIDIDMNAEPWVDYHRTYRATVSADGQSMNGKWYTPGRTQPATMDFQRVTSAAKAWPIPVPPTQHFVSVQPGVKIETLDWGGSGRPVVLLAGLGNSAPDMYPLAHDLVAHYHVYGVTRRGFGTSSKPAPTAANYSATRLADDVMAVLDALKIEKPVLIGHSMAGEELSSIGKRYPQRVAGLVYLDAGYSYALYDPSNGDVFLDAKAVQNDLAKLGFGPNEKSVVDDLLAIQLPRLQRDLRSEKAFDDALPADMPKDPNEAAGEAIVRGEQIFEAPIDVPILAIFASPHALGILSKAPPKQRAAAQAADDADTTAQIAYFRRKLANARVVVIPHANHYVFISNEAQVLREINAFIKTLREQ